MSLHQGSNGARARPASKPPAAMSPTKLSRQRLEPNGASTARHLPLSMARSGEKQRHGTAVRKEPKREATRPRLNGVSFGAVSAEQPGRHASKETMLPPRKRARSSTVKDAEGTAAAAPHLAPGSEIGKERHAAISQFNLAGPRKRVEAPPADECSGGRQREGSKRGPEQGHEEGAAAKQAPMDWEAYAMDMAWLAAEAEAVLAEEDDDL